MCIFRYVTLLLKVTFTILHAQFCASQEKVLWEQLLSDVELSVNLVHKN
jgi:hypothetical protein